MRALGGDNFVATIGPAICAKCYEVDIAMYLDAISLEPALSTNPELHCLDLRKAARSQLTNIGVEVVDIDICTAHDANYFSYRRDGVTGRSAGVIVL
jgi:copper oxidase (laccase) domain-containing protein